MRSEINAFDLYARQFATVADRAVITFAPPVFERDDFLVLALFENFSRHLCSGDKRVAVSHVFSVGKQQYITKRGSFAWFDIEKIDIERVAFRDAKLPATSSDDCVSHSFSGEKKPSKIPHLSALGKRKRIAQRAECAVLSALLSRQRTFLRQRTLSRLSERSYAAA